MLEWGISMSEEHDIISMLPLEHDFEIEPVQKDIDFEKGYTKVRLTQNQKMQISAATQQLPGLAAGIYHQISRWHQPYPCVFKKSRWFYEHVYG